MSNGLGLPLACRYDARTRLKEIVVPTSTWIILGLVGLAGIILAFLEGLRRKKERAEESRMSPEDRAVRQRERKAFQQVFRRMR